jgi:hypothetical protein
MLDDAAVEFVTCTERPPDSPHSKPLNYRIWNEPTYLVCKHQGKPFLFLELLGKRTLNMWPLVSQDTQSAIYREKRSSRKRGSYSTLIPIKNVTEMHILTFSVENIIQCNEFTETNQSCTHTSVRSLHLHEIRSDLYSRSLMLFLNVIFAPPSIEHFTKPGQLFVSSSVTLIMIRLCFHDT